MLHLASTLVLLLIGAGLFYRRRPGWHLRFMTAAFVTDLLLVLYIEATRHAVEKVASHYRTIVWVHAGISLAVLGCYVAMIVLGRKVHAGQSASRSTHRNLGMTFVVLRVLNYVTAFAV